MLKNNVLHDICSRGKIHFLSHISCVDFDIKLLKIVLPAKNIIRIYAYIHLSFISLPFTSPYPSAFAGETSFQAFTRKSIIKVKKSFPDNPIPAYPVISLHGYIYRLCRQSYIPYFPSNFNLRICSIAFDLINPQICWKSARVIS